MGEITHRRREAPEHGHPVCSSLIAKVGGLVLASFGLIACGKEDEQIRVYRVVKAPLENAAPQSMPPSSSMSLPPDHPPVAAGANVPAAASSNASNVAGPSHWEPQPLAQMRKASFLVRGENGTVADVSLVTLGASGGDVLGNVNRWLGQLGQPPITAEQLPQVAKHLPGEGITVVDLEGKPEQGDPSKDGRIIAAIAPADNGTAFFKLRGNPALVGAEKVNFLKWVSSMRSGAGADDTTTASSGPGSGKPQIKWEIPPGWSSAPASAMRYASFTAADESSGKIDISVVAFPGDGGSDLDNVNRWRQQIGLPATSEQAMSSMITPLETAEGNFSSSDMTGTNSRMLAAWTRHEGRTWFFKVTGPTAAVEKEKSNFVKFIQSVRFES